jgi:ribosomal protein S18 acetylase RimI-like enzyme
MAGEAQAVRLRAAQAADYDFARRVHHAGMRWIGERLFGWDDAVQNARFDGKFVLSEVRIIAAGGTDVGYLQTAVSADALDLKEFHIDAPFQNRGIGAQVLRLLLAEARALGKAVTVSVAEFNPARAFYERAGFRVVGREAHKLYMRHDGGQPRGKPAPAGRPRE